MKVKEPQALPRKVVISLKLALKRLWALWTCSKLQGPPVKAAWVEGGEDRGKSSCEITPGIQLKETSRRVVKTFLLYKAKKKTSLETYLKRDKLKISIYSMFIACGMKLILKFIQIISYILMLLWRNFCSTTSKGCGVSQWLDSLSTECIIKIPTHHHKLVFGFPSAHFSWCLSACSHWTVYADALIIPLTFYSLVHIFNARV